MSRRGGRAPQEPDFVLRGLEQGNPDDLVDRADLEGLSFAGVPVGPLRLRDATVVGCRFEQLHSPEVDLRGAAVRETEVDNPGLTIVRAWRGRWNDVRVRSGRLGVLEAHEAVWTTVAFVGCRLSFVNLRGAQLDNLVLRDCRIEELDLTEATLHRASLAGTHVQRLTLSGAKAEHVDLTGCTYDELSGPDGLRGTIITDQQLAELAPLLARSWGIDVVGDG